jgi:hypothetical protein
MGKKKQYKNVDYTEIWLEYIKTDEYNNFLSKQKYIFFEQSFDPFILKLMAKAPNYHFNAENNIIIQLLSNESINISFAHQTPKLSIVTNEKEFRQAIEYMNKNKPTDFIDELCRILNLYRPMPSNPVIEHNVNYQERWHTYVRSGKYFRENICAIVFTESDHPNCTFVKQHLSSLSNYTLMFTGQNLALLLLPLEYSDYPACEYIVDIQVIYEGKNLAVYPRRVNFDNVITFGFVTPEKQFSIDVRNLCVGPDTHPFCILPLARIDQLVNVIKKYRPLPKKEEYVKQINEVLSDKFTDQRDISTIIAEYNNPLK